MCLQNGCIVWPRFVGRLRALNWCHHPVPVRNVWGEFIPFGPGLITPGCFRSDFTVVNHGTSPVFRNVDCGRTNIKIRAYAQCVKDLGKKITLYGIDSHGQEITTRNADDTYTPGVELVLAKPFVSTTMDVRTVTRISKEETECPVRLFQYDTVNNVLLEMATYEPSETEPQYLASIMSTSRCVQSSSCNGQQSITALFKLALLPLRDDTDIAPVQNLQAIKQMIQSIRAEEKGDDQAALAKETRAVHEMNLQEQDYIPTDQLAVQMSTWGTAPLERSGIGWNI